MLRHAGKLMLLLGCSQLCASVVQAEIFVLRKGKVIHGKWLNSDEEKPSEYRIETEDGFEIVLDAKDVEKVEKPTPLEQVYRERISEIKDSAPSHEKVVEWLEKEGMQPLANAHRERIIELDPSDNKSRRKLRYIEVDGEWISEAKYARRYGVVREGNKWVLALEAQLNRFRETQKQAETRAGQKVQMAVKDIRDQSPRRYEQQVQYLQQLADPDAFPKLKELALEMREQRNSDDLRLLLVQAISRIKTSGAMTFLCDCAIFDPDVRIRNLSLDMVKTDAPGVGLQVFLRQLGTNDVAIIERAGEALGYLGDPRAVPYLIEAVVTRHRIQVGGGGNQTSAGFSSDGGTNFSPGGGKPQFREVENNNRTVLQALVDLCPGVNYEFDKAAWLNWYAETHAPTGRDLRRDP